MVAPLLRAGTAPLRLEPPFSSLRFVPHLPNNALAHACAQAAPATRWQPLHLPNSCLPAAAAAVAASE